MKEDRTVLWRWWAGGTQGLDIGLAAMNIAVRSMTVLVFEYQFSTLRVYS